MKRALPEFVLDGSGPLYRQIKRAIAQPILTGRCDPGTRLPSEHEFTEIFGTSRMTVNRALQMLADDGMVVRHRRSGTFVAPRVVEHAVMKLRDIADEIVETGAVYGYELLEWRTILASATVAERLGVPAGSLAIILKCRHLGDGRPMVIEERYINAGAIPAVTRETFADTPPSRWLLETVPWSRAEHTILAVNADVLMAALLNIPSGTACLQVERRTWRADLPVTFVILTYPGKSHRLISNFSPGQ